MYDDIQELLDFGTTNVYYVVWNQNGKIYYLLDTTPDYLNVIWTKTREHGLYFTTEGEASRVSKGIRNTSRPGVSIITAEINVLEDFD